MDVPCRPYTWQRRFVQIGIEHLLFEEPKPETQDVFAELQRSLHSCDLHLKFDFQLGK